MAVTLAQAKLNAQDHVDTLVIDEFRKQSAVLDALPFDQAVNPAGGGSTLTYGYTRQITQADAAFRAINSEYTPGEVTKARYTVDLVPLGGSFQIDRVLADVARGAEVTLQMQQKIKATTTKFTDALINGDTVVDANGFDGLLKALTGSSTELNSDGSMSIDWSDLDAAGVASKGYDRLDDLLSMLDGPATMLFGNQAVGSKLRAIARRANAYVEAPVTGLTDGNGNPVTRQRIGNTIFVDPGEKAGSSNWIMPLYDADATTYTLTVTGSPTGGTFKLKVTDPQGVSKVTGTIAFDATGATIDTAIEALTNVGTAGVVVTGSAGGAWSVTFPGTKDYVVSLDTNSLTGGTAPSVTVAETGGTGGFADLIAVRIGLDGFHGVATTASQLVRTWLPDFTTSGAVKTGEVEMGPVAPVLKATKAAAVLRRIKVR